jgi:hypothetical protein
VLGELSRWLLEAPDVRSWYCLGAAVPAGALLLAVGSRVAQRWPWSGGLARASARLGAFALIALGILQATLYLTHPMLFDPYEASVASLSGIVGSGQPLIHAPDDPYRYVQIGYGPVLYFWNAAFVRLFGSTIPACKAAGVTSFSAALVLMVLVGRSRTSQHAWLSLRGLVAGAVLALLLGYFGHYAFWTRADPHIVLCATAAGVAVAHRAWTPRIRALLLGLALGLAVNLKITAAVYLAPFVVVFLLEEPRKVALLALGVSVFVAALPFCLPGVSLAAYLAWLRVLGSQGVGSRTVILWEGMRALFYATPLLALWMLKTFGPARWSWKRHLHAASCLACAAAVAVFASKTGAGEHHFMPLFPALIYAVSRDFPSRIGRRIDLRGAMVLGMVATFLLEGVPKHRDLWTMEMENQRYGNVLVDELRGFMAAHPRETVEMGTADLAYLWPGYYRPVLVYAGQPFHVDIGTLMDLDSVNRGVMPDAMIERVRQCRTSFFLIPRWGEPFETQGVYHTGRNVYDARYVTAFRAAYHRVASLEHFDVFACSAKR